MSAEFHYKDKVRVKSGFYAGETGELTGYEHGRYCMTLDRDGRFIFIKQEAIDEVLEKIS